VQLALALSVYAADRLMFRPLRFLTEPLFM